MEINTQEDMDQAKLEYFRYLRGLKEWPAEVTSEKRRADFIGVSVSSLAGWRLKYDWENAEVSKRKYDLPRRDGRQDGGYYRQTNLLVGYKPCPKCDGTGEVLCHGKEHHMQRSLMWAGSWHGRAVTVEWLVAFHEWGRIPGWAVAAVAPGGYGCLHVFVSVDKVLPWGGFLDLRMSPYYDQYEDFRGHRLYYKTVHWGRGDEVEAYHEPIPELETVLGMIESPLVLVETVG